MNSDYPTILLSVFILQVLAAIMAYMSPRALHHIAALCVGRAAGIRHSARVKGEELARHGVTARVRPVKHEQLSSGIVKPDDYLTGQRITVRLDTEDAAAVSSALSCQDGGCGCCEYCLSRH